MDFPFHVERAPGAKTTASVITFGASYARHSAWGWAGQSGWLSARVRGFRFHRVRQCYFAWLLLLIIFLFCLLFFLQTFWYPMIFD